MMKSANARRLSLTVVIFCAAALTAQGGTSIGEPAVAGPREIRSHAPRGERRVKVDMPISYKKCPTGEESAPTASAEFEAEVVRLVNEERKRARLPALTVDTNLTRAARYHANDMVTEDYFSHPSQDREGGRLVSACGTFERIGRFAPNGSAENIAAGQRTPADVMRSWMNSPGHKRNILSNRRTIGVGVARGEKGYGIYWVQNFGS